MAAFLGRRITPEAALWGLELGLGAARDGVSGRGWAREGTPGPTGTAATGGILVREDPGSVMDEPASGHTSVTPSQAPLPGRTLVYSSANRCVSRGHGDRHRGPQKQPRTYAEGGEEQSPTRKAVWLKHR